MGNLINIKYMYKYKLKTKEGEKMQKEKFKPIMATPTLSGNDVKVIIENLDVKPSKKIKAKSKKRASVLSKFL